MPTRKKAPAKKSATKKSSAKKRAIRKPAKKASAKAASGRKSGGALHKVARSIGSTLGTIAKKTGDAVEAAKNALPAPLGSGDAES